MNVFCHYDISQSYEPITAAYPLKNLQEQITAVSVFEQRLPPVATEGEGM
jgi:hypothetical protein